MRLVRFLSGARVGLHYFEKGSTAGVPDRLVDRFVRLGAIEVIDAPPEADEVIASAPDSEEVEADSPETASAVKDRVTKPAPAGMSKSALKRLLRMKA